ncbi:MAG: carboxylesterase family protein, partial [Lachnospiraceae bacterium]|nr:carboxylesterase family protein [Lachnospiraceae bacterium]
KEARSEDSLYLNIWTPANVKAGEKLPVLFYIHGGSLNSGQSYYRDYNGETLAKKGIIVVTITYRLGVFGYLANDELAAESENNTTGNYGLLDQIAALQWVNDNINSFGGDKDNITIAGESAGASSVNAICVSPLAKGLFRRAVAESSGITAVVPYHTFRTMEDAKKVGNDILKEFNCDSVEELRQIPAEKLVDTRYSNNEMTVDGYAITEQPYLTYEKGENNEEAILGGYNANEAYVFLMFSKDVTLDNYERTLRWLVGREGAEELEKMYPAATDEEAWENYVEIMGLIGFGYSHYRWSELMTAEERPAYLYYFTKENGGIGTWHAGEMPYMYGNLFRNPGCYDESDEALSETMQSYLVNYVTTGNPNGGDLPEWKTYGEECDQIMSFGEKVGMIEQKHNDFYKIVDTYMEGLRE